MNLVNVECGVDFVDVGYILVVVDLFDLEFHANLEFLEVRLFVMKFFSPPLIPFREMASLLSAIISL